MSRTASIVGELLWACLAPVFVYADSALDKSGTAGFALAVSSMWLVGVVSLVLLLFGLAQLWSLRSLLVAPIGTGRIRCFSTRARSNGRGNGFELYTVTARGTESDIGHTIFLIAEMILAEEPPDS